MSNIQVTHDTSLDNARSESSLVINSNNTQQIIIGSKKFINYHTYDFTLATCAAQKSRPSSKSDRSKR
jgi:hypothetical protein